MKFTLVSSLARHHHGTSIALESRICLAVLLYYGIETSHFKLDETLLHFHCGHPVGDTQKGCGCFNLRCGQLNLCLC